MSARSWERGVRNPIASDPEVAAVIGTLTVHEKMALVRVLGILSKSWRGKAKKSWESHKAPMAAYHKANAVNARHLSLALRGRVG